MGCCKKQLTFTVLASGNSYTHYLAVDSTTNFGQATHNGTSLTVSGGGRLVTITVAAVADWKAIEVFQTAYNTLMGDSALVTTAVDIDTDSIDPSAVVVS
jgi:hypothetical protein